ncbi:uncharacterized protein LOC110712346 [Chenopodium quinoa]|uniref:uncharacterized protein LOC110712346 n=1 Tax=Chenopodium quinoa TaxID=63459 RepID=UPI000B790B79|nr:uncharacterized protein LOC110712346 [Chenopodium quinoa]
MYSTILFCQEFQVMQRVYGCNGSTFDVKDYRVMLELEAQACENENEVIEINGSSLNVTTSSQANDDPMYLKLWEKSKRHKNGKFDDEAEEKSWSVILDRGNIFKLTLCIKLPFGCIFK